MAEGIDYNEIITKYSGMLQSRKENGDIDINDYIPDINDMIKEDCVWDTFNSLQGELGGDNDDVEDIAYYTEAPPSTKLGYDEASQSFTLRVTSKSLAESGDSWELGNIDGDTWPFYLSDFDSGGSFTINGKTYANYKEYAAANNITSEKIDIRAVGIDAKEICHYTTCVVSKDKTKIKTVTYEQAVTEGYTIMPYKLNKNGSSDPSKWTTESYNDDDRITLLEVEGNYYQIASEFNAEDYITPNEGFNAYVVVGNNEWGKETLVDAYKAQQRARDLFENNNIKDMIVVLDRQTIVGERIPGTASKYYNSFFYSYKNIGTLAQELWSGDTANFQMASVGFAPFGYDTYGRALGNVWVKIDTADGEQWINVSKYVAAETDFTETNPSFSGTAMEGIYGGASDAFKQWNNISNEFRYVDSLNADGEKSYEDRLKLHKHLTGIDFKVARDHTVLLGDSLFLIPPEAIHISSSLDYERVPVLRGKGSMMKNRTNIEEVLEIELYFHNEYGINGIPYKCQTPNGQELTYYMNGLRALIAQFRTAPFLPIENHYINDILDIEVVSLINMSMSTVDGFPKLLKVVLTLREFNYRVFMPDLPVPEYNADSETISEMQPVFAKLFDWELFRYYYQRGILNGNALESYEYNSFDYNKFMYSNKNIYKKADLTDCHLEVFVPDVAWLKYALQVKKAKDRYGGYNEEEMQKALKEIESGNYNSEEDDGDDTITDNEEEILFNYYHYYKPENMKFVPYMANENGASIPIELDALSINMANYFTETHLKACDGYAPQYMGGSDVMIEIKATITDEYYVGAYKNLPHYIMNLIRTYRRVMPCFPLKVKNDYLQMLGVNEVTLDNVSVSTVPGHPGVYDLTIKLTSMDRSMRQREALSKVENEDGMTSSNAAYDIYSYWNLEEALAEAELYPDLDLPQIEELKSMGWRFAKWSNENRRYVDPDFYICYSFAYTSKLIKELVNNVLYRVIYSEGKLDDSGNNSSDVTGDAAALTSMTILDNMNIELNVVPSAKSNGLELKGQNEYGDEYDNITTTIQASANAENKKKKKKEDGPTVEEARSMVEDLTYLTALGIQNGWQISPGWYAPLCSQFVNDEMEKLPEAQVDQAAETNEAENLYLKEIYELRAKAITLINSILSGPIVSSKDEKTNDRLKCVNDAVDNVFKDGEGAELLELLCPIEGVGVWTENKVEASQQNDPRLRLTSEYFSFADPLRWMKGYLFALACTRSALDDYADGRDENSWFPNQWQSINNTGEGAPPYNKARQGKGLAGDGILTTDIESSGDDVISYGAGQITIYNIDTIKTMLQPESKIKYFPDGDSANHMYNLTKAAGRKRFCETGFIDTYYNFQGYKSSAGKEFCESITNCMTANLEALLREALVHLKRLIMDGYIFSEVDVVSQDWESVFEGVLDDPENFGTVFAPKTTDIDPNVNYHINSYRNSILEYQEDQSGLTEEEQEQENAETEKYREMAEGLKEEIPKSYAKLFCSRLIYPFAMAACNGNKNILELFRTRNYQQLDVYTLSTVVGGTNDALFNRFLGAMCGACMIRTSEISESGEVTSNTQKAFNTLLSEAYTALTNDPKCYALHSFYDMCVNDKRGRLVRAFPCYYIFFVDEGRTIGTWKLFDNFYNMSSISNIQVVKSRKIAADTCTFTMSNMFLSYADTYDNTIQQQYANVYGFKDTFDSVFSPRKYIAKEDALRKRKQLADTTTIQPGVRIHVRMGYGSDGSKLPIVFNGKIAEVHCGETVDIVAQGDGHELMNPLNTLGDLTAINLDESQSWTTLLKDIRGSLARGGQTPRNLLAKIATAQHGGVLKTVVREASNGRWFYDNPFGICHFGDKRFQDIFTESEIVQNMYEVSNKTILNGINDLLDDISTVGAAPTLNCNIQDKTMWEIGHLCANSGDDFYFAIRDFGLRSTMCLCRSNHYYAYAYQRDEASGTIGERRKPFQQFHYYDSYNDIIYNSLKASETNMKTNAIGTWEGTDYLWGTSQQSVGPIYLDMNIYPEYQKSMTVETGLVAGGDGLIDIPIFNALAEKYNFNEYAGRVNKSVAEKVTTNVLRQSVKDMYEGEICVIADPTLKPYDRVTIVDLYEDMSGDVEVETVIHSMNIETGFTTTFIPDLIVRVENTAQECGYQSVLSSIILGLAGISLKGGIMHAAAGTSGLIKLGSKGLVDLGGKFFAEGASKAILTNPVALASAAVGAGCVFMLAQNAKEMFTRFCRNIQALTVFPITKNSRLLVAGMSGHKGSVFGYNYEDTAMDSIQGFIMNFTSGEHDSFGMSVLQSVFNSVLTDDNYKTVTRKWRNNLGLTNSEDVIQDDASYVRNRESFFQFLSSAISKEYSSRAISLAALKTKPRLTSFDTGGKTDPTYLKYQIGGISDKSESELEKLGFDPDSDQHLISKVDVSGLASHERIKHLLPVEDDPEIKLGVFGSHPVIKSFKFAHSKSLLTFNLIMEDEKTVIRFLEEGGIYDLPMLQDDALMILKLILNESNLKGKTVTFVSGTRVNDPSSWKSTGFWFSLTCDDMKALEAASKDIRKDSSWHSDKYTFAYKNTGSSIQYTVYAPIEDTDSFNYTGGDTSNE